MLQEQPKENDAPRLSRSTPWQAHVFLYQKKKNNKETDAFKSKEKMIPWLLNGIINILWLLDGIINIIWLLNGLNNDCLLYHSTVSESVKSLTLDCFIASNQGLHFLKKACFHNADLNLFLFFFIYNYKQPMDYSVCPHTLFIKLLKSSSSSPALLGSSIT